MAYTMGWKGWKELGIKEGVKDGFKEVDKFIEDVIKDAVENGVKSAKSSGGSSSGYRDWETPVAVLIRLVLSHLRLLGR